ncbi:hypothetical protein [Neobacillus kokaensis]|uniref:Uncharacterized protein n=1 Tax=Neobacillus kokaensis TaxID=2759023 RepID=A0ABQ3N1N6_9BACI|nr:hypothetical protein [Neobacillus kokaensis]GHH98858.1 hypothetical protein AM1BK_24010 [Neobacillus kokaensis]
MKRIKGLVYSTIVILIVVGWFTIQKITDDTYEGMSIIPEQTKDVPLFKGLKPTEHKYVMEGNHWKDIYNFYSMELPKYGWKLDYEQKSSNEDVNGFISGWRKNGLEWELYISADYFKMTNRTEVIFDKTSIGHATTWIYKVPTSICIYQSSSEERCSVIKDRTKIKGIVRFINDAIDWDKEVFPREKTSIIDTGDIQINVLHEDEKEIYLQSEKGTKIAKPEQEFFKLLNLK